MRLTMLLAGRVAFVFVILSALLVDAQELAAPAIRSTMPFQLRSEFLVIVSGKVGDLDRLKFILDTGSSHTLIDRKVADRLKLRLNARKVTNFDRDIPVEWAEVPNLVVGPLHTDTFRVLVANLGDYSKFAENVDGILGLDLLGRSRRFFIDYEKQTVTWEIPAEDLSRSAPPTYFSIPFVVQGLPMHLVIDTGLQGILLYKDRLHKALPGLRTEGEAIEVGMGRVQMTQVKLPGVRLPGSEGVETVFLADCPAAGEPPGVDGYLGIASLKAKRVEFDFASRMLRWE